MTEEKKDDKTVKRVIPGLRPGDEWLEVEYREESLRNAKWKNHGGGVSSIALPLPVRKKRIPDPTTLNNDMHVSKPLTFKKP